MMKGLPERFLSWNRRRNKRRKYYDMYKRAQAYTMQDAELFADKLELAESIEHLPGDVVECGVWKGGMSAAFADLLNGERHYYLFDSFEGMPPPTEEDGVAAQQWFEGKMPESYYDNCSAEERYAHEIMQSTTKPYSLVKGWFETTVPDFELNNQISLLHIDADWYDSVFICLTHFFPKLAQGGLIIFDDYYWWDGCSRAVHDYLSSVKSNSRIYRTRNGVAYILKKDD